MADFLYLAFLIPYEISVCSSIANQWNSDVPKYAIIIAFIIVYIALNLLSVNIYGDAEGIFAALKMVFLFSLMLFTIIMMCGGNSKHDAFGFRNWNSQPLFKEYYTNGRTGRFLGFLQSIAYAASAITGPEYVSLVSAEIQLPRKNLPRAFRSTIYRLIFFFFFNALISSFAASTEASFILFILKMTVNIMMITYFILMMIQC